MICPVCGQQNPEEMKFCGACGAALVNMCPDCGFDNPPGFNFCGQCGRSLNSGSPGGQAVPQPSGTADKASGTVPTSFANGRYQVKRFLGEGGKKKVYLAHDTTLDREVAFALIKTKGLDNTPAHAYSGRPRPWGGWDPTNTLSPYSTWVKNKTSPTWSPN